MSKIIQARFLGALGERREKRINDVLDRFDAWKLVPSGQRLKLNEEEDVEFMHSAVDWNEDEDGTQIEFAIEDEKAVRIASELRACGLMVTARAE